MPKNTVTETKPVAAPSFKSFVKLCGSDNRPRGIKAKVNDDGGYTFSYKAESAPVAVIASKDEVAKLGLSTLGLKLS